MTAQFPRVLPAIAGLILSSASIGQEPVAAPTVPATPPTAPAPITPAPARPARPLLLISIDFPGGTVKQFVEAVRTAAGPGKVNVVLPKAAEDVQIPAVSLKDVSPQIALETLKYSADQESDQFSVSNLSKGEEGSLTYAIQHGPRRMGQPSMPVMPPPKSSTRVFSIRDLIEMPQNVAPDAGAALTTETVLSAVKSMAELEVRAKSAPPEFMLHKDSLLLIVRGTTDQLSAVESVLSELRGSIQGKRVQAEAEFRRDQTIRLERVEMEAHLDQTSQQLKATEDEFARATDRLERLAKLAEAGTASAVELENGKAMLATARTIYEQAKIAHRAAQERAAILRARAEAGGTGVGLEAPTVVVYDARDLAPFQGDIVELCKAVVDESGSKETGIQLGWGRDAQGTLIVKARPRQHKIIVQALNTIRRAKANEPKLPGLDADDLIRKGEKK